MIRFDLCGMGVDMIRSAYRTKMRLEVGSNAETEVQWFFCAPGAKVYPGYTRFGSGNWAGARYDWPGTGEVLGASRKWVKGDAPKVGLYGKGFCGKWELIRDGWSASDPPLPCHADGKAKCCPGVTANLGLRPFANLATFVKKGAPGCPGFPLTNWSDTLSMTWSEAGPFGYSISAPLTWQYGLSCGWGGVSPDGIGTPFGWLYPPGTLNLSIQWIGIGWYYRMWTGFATTVSFGTGSFDGFAGLCTNAGKVFGANTSSTVTI